MSVADYDPNDMNLDIFGGLSDTDAEDTFEFKFDNYTLASTGEVLRLTLIKRHHSLWGEYIYNAARILSDIIDRSVVKVNGRTVLELGAGAGLPGVVSALNGASVTVLSDYGTERDSSLMAAIDANVDYTEHLMKGRGLTGIIKSVPFIWGCDVSPLTLHSSSGHVFDIILLADLIFNRSEHRKLLATVKDSLRPVTGIAWVTFSHHDPLKRELDLNFFTLAEGVDFGFAVTYVGKEERASYPFVEGDGLDDQRGIVYIYTLSLPHR